MPCIKHDCLQCGYIWLDNGEQKNCPSCKKITVEETLLETDKEENEIPDPSNGPEP